MDPVKAHEGECDRYDAQARAWGWNPEVFFGLMWSFVRPGDRLLDAGIGTGLCSRPFHKAGVSIAGMDASAGMLRTCRERHPTFQLVRHDLQRRPWPYGDNAFDHVIAGGVLHFFGNLEPVLREAQRVLKTGGVLGFNTSPPGKEPLEQAGATAGKTYFRALDEASGVTIYQHGEAYVQNLLKKLGMSVEKKLTFLASRNPQTGVGHVSTLFVARSYRVKTTVETGCPGPGLRLQALPEPYS